MIFQLWHCSGILGVVPILVGMSQRAFSRQRCRQVLRGGAFGEIDALVVWCDPGADDANARRLQLGNDGILIRYACPQLIDDVNANYKVFVLRHAIGAICSQSYHQQKECRVHR